MKKKIKTATVLAMVLSVLAICISVSMLPQIQKPDPSMGTLINIK